MPTERGTWGPPAYTLPIPDLAHSTGGETHPQVGGVLRGAVLGGLRAGDCGLVKSDNIFISSSWKPSPLPTLPSCPGPGGPWYKAERPQRRETAIPLMANKSPFFAVAGGRAGGLAEGRALQGGAPTLPKDPREFPSLAQGRLSSPSSDTGIPGTRRQLQAAAPAGTWLQAAAGGAGAGPGPILGAAESPGLGQPGLPILGTSGLKPGGQEASGAAWVLCLKGLLPHPPLSPSPDHSCPQQWAWWAHSSSHVAGLNSFTPVN